MSVYQWAIFQTPKLSFQIFQGRSKDSLTSVMAGEPEFNKMVEFQPYDKEKVITLCTELSKNILMHKKRLGGNFAVAFSAPSQVLREACKEVLGPQLIFVCIRLSKEANKKRVAGRHAASDEETMKGLEEYLNGIYDLYEDTQPGEENCVTVNVGPDDSKEVVMNNILKLVEELEASKG